MQYTSKNNHISKSAQHADMWIITNMDTNKFHTLHTSEEAIKQIHKPDDHTMIKRIIKRR
jgi:hypothetical protein